MSSPRSGATLAQHAKVNNTARPAESTDDARVVRVWDAPTRLFHWLATLLVAAAYVTWRLNWMDWHAWTGDALLGLLVFRLLWGFFGSATARFSGFLVAPRAARFIWHPPSAASPTADWVTIRLAVGWFYCCSRSCLAKR